MTSGQWPVASGKSMTRDELEFQISQYLDGTLAEAERSALDARLAVDADARALLDQYHRLDFVLKAAPVPSVNWEALSAQISGAVAEQEDIPAKTYRIGFARTLAGLAVAASVLIGLGFGIRLLQPSRSDRANNPVIAKSPTEIVVVDAVAAAPTPGASTQPPEAIAVGPSNTLEDRPGFAGFHDDVISRPSQVFIARSGQALHDGAFLP